MSAEPEAIEFGRRLKALRRYRRLTIAELAEVTGLNRQTINNLELGRYLPTVKTLILLDQALGEKVERFTLLEVG